MPVRYVSRAATCNNGLMIFPSRTTARSRAFGLGLALLCIPGALTWAQSGTKPSIPAQSRREELAKLQEMLSDPDPNARLAYLEEIVKTDDVTKIQSALRIVFQSDDQHMRALAVRAYIASFKELTFDLQLQPEIQRQYDDAQADPAKGKELLKKFPYIEFLSKQGFRLRLVFGTYDISSSGGIVSGSSLGNGSNGAFTTSGDRVTGSVRATLLRPGARPTHFYSDANNTTVECNFAIRATNGTSKDLPSWRGTLACQDWGDVTIPRIAISTPMF
jgi:hypothetical protein